jgi:hypothetical protein
MCLKISQEVFTSKFKIMQPDFEKRQLLLKSYKPGIQQKRAAFYIKAARLKKLCISI